MKSFDAIPRSLAGLAAATALLVSPLAVAETFSGSILGHTCAEHGRSCPIDKLDPHLAIEPDFVLSSGDGKHYFLVNVPRDTKVRYALEKVTVKGELRPPHNAIKVTEMVATVKGKQKVVWSPEIQAEQLRQFYGE